VTLIVFFTIILVALFTGLVTAFACYGFERYLEDHKKAGRQ
jgi:hypothetical protein